MPEVPLWPLCLYIQLLGGDQRSQMQNGADRSINLLIAPPFLKKQRCLKFCCLLSHDKLTHMQSLHSQLEISSGGWAPGLKRQKKREE